MKKIFIRAISLVMISLILISCCACKNSKGDKDTASKDNTSNKVSEVVKESDYIFGKIDASAMFDGDTGTAWNTESEDAVTVEFTSKNEVTFNALALREYDTFLEEFVLEIKQGDEYKTVCILDEMGIRTTILDETYTATEFKMTVDMSDQKGGISEMEFLNVSKFENKTDFRNVGYFCSSSLENIRENSFDKLSGYTDLILFDYGCWNENGEFLWGSMYERINEAQLVETINEIRSLPGGKNIRLWFCLQNYDKENIENTDVLFTTNASRERLANFAVELCKKYGFYGIDIDYEYPSSATSWQNYDAFLNLCADKLHNNGYKLSCALSSWGVKISNETAAKIDYVNIMAYDYFNFGDDRHASYAIAEHCLTYFTSIGFKPEQLILGMPFYRRTMDSTHTSGGGYNTIVERWRKGIKPWVNVVTNKTWVYYYNGPNMIRDKVYFAMKNNMAGVFCWSLRNDIANDNIYGVPSLGQTVIDTIERFGG